MYSFDITNKLSDLSHGSLSHVYETVLFDAGVFGANKRNCPGIIASLDESYICLQGFRHAYHGLITIKS